jgi:hypothetical protein
LSIVTVQFANASEKKKILLLFLLKFVKAWEKTSNFRRVFARDFSRRVETITSLLSGLNKVVCSVYFSFLKISIVTGSIDPIIVRNINLRRHLLYIFFPRLKRLQTANDTAPLYLIYRHQSNQNNQQQP